MPSWCRWFNYRVTRFLVNEGGTAARAPSTPAQRVPPAGFYEFHNWFDDTTWYPLGRFIGGTLYPGALTPRARFAGASDLRHPWPPRRALPSPLVTIVVPRCSNARDDGRAGLMWTSAAIYHLANWLHFSVDIRNVCVLLAPWMAGNTSIAVYLLTKETWNSAAGVMAAMFIAICPGPSSPAPVPRRPGWLTFCAGFARRQGTRRALWPAHTTTKPWPSSL